MEALQMQRVRMLLYAEQELTMTLANAASEFEKQVSKHRPQLDTVRRNIAEAEADLAWTRLERLIHTPCWRYRVAA